MLTLISLFFTNFNNLFFKFFIAADPAVRNERLWHEKYSLRKMMVPSFIPLELATRVSQVNIRYTFMPDLSLCLLCVMRNYHMYISDLKPNM